MREKRHYSDEIRWKETVCLKKIHCPTSRRTRRKNMVRIYEGNCNQTSITAVWHKKQSELFSISVSEMQHVQKDRFDAIVKLNNQNRVHLLDLMRSLLCPLFGSATLRKHCLYKFIREADWSGPF